MSKRQRAEKVAVAMPVPGASANWLRGIRLSGFTIMTLAIIVLFIVVLAPSLRIWVDQRQEIAALEAEVKAAEEALDDLKDERARWDDPSYVETQARERLYYVKPGEFSYLVIDDGATVTTPSGVPISDELQTTEVDWVKTM
ncbi:MAG TPA: septum formation initiator family protein, partial [Homoserinimonas sp.]|nr:septum formation initiator family protein [Homoserinimonas sp.]